MSKATKNKTDKTAILIEQYNKVRAVSEAICQPLETEDYVIQSTEDVSPSKWHIGHTSWFFEQVILEQFVKNYKPYSDDFYFMFNSYYNTFGQRVLRPLRGTMSRPTVREVYDYRREIDKRMRQLFENIEPDKFESFAELVELGLNHEQQHQELNMTDIKWNLGANPLLPLYKEIADLSDSHKTADQPEYIKFEGGIHKMGHDNKSFSYDNETPRHEILLQDFALMDRLVTCGEYLEFINNKGYEKANLWLDDGWALINQLGWSHPPYWSRSDDGWKIYTLGGVRALNLSEPVCHVSYYEAAAFARWAGKRLPTEFEWERAAESVSGKIDKGNFYDSGRFHPIPSTGGKGLKQMFGDVWEWTNSAYLPYPGYIQVGGALGEYNGKFMSGQMVCRGGSCATSLSHFRPSYRNFFQPEKRWQFLGFRLASDV